MQLQLLHQSKPLKNWYLMQRRLRLNQHLKQPLLPRFPQTQQTLSPKLLQLTLPGSQLRLLPNLRQPRRHWRL